MMNEVDGMRQEDYNVSNRICTILYVVLIDGDQILFFQYHFHNFDGSAPKSGGVFVDSVDDHIIHSNCVYLRDLAVKNAMGDW